MCDLPHKTAVMCTVSQGRTQGEGANGLNSPLEKKVVPKHFNNFILGIDFKL